jgi:hypothetical protein
MRKCRLILIINIAIKILNMVLENKGEGVRTSGVVFNIGET